MGLLDGAIKKAIADGFRGKLLSGTLTKIVATGRDASNGDPTTTTADYAFQGFREAYSAFFRAQAGIPDDDTKITLIAGLCGAAPAIGDKININGGWWQVRKVAIDPAGATYDCQCFGVPS
jgi:hypothetical protein